ncbi:MAG: hypothetical protein WBF39_11050 [Planococcus donghaensis]
MKTAKDRKEDKLTVEQLLRIEGISYDEWLDGLHDEILNRPSSKDIMRKALQNYTEDIGQKNERSTTNSNENAY